MERFPYNHPEHGDDAGRSHPEQEVPVAQLLKSYPHLSALTFHEHKLPTQLLDLTDVFAAIGKEHDAQQQLAVLEELFAEQNMGDIFRHLYQDQSLERDLVVQMLRTNEHFAHFTQALLPLQDDYPFPLAVLLSHYTQAALPAQWYQHLQPRLVPEPIKPSLTERIPEWYLCDMSEPYLIQAMDNQAVTNVNDVLLVKHVGRLAGLCVMTATSDAGTLLRGNWYAPVDKAIRQQLQNAHDSGTAYQRMGGTWTLMRSLTSYAGIDASDIVNRAEDCLVSLPDQLPGRIENATRQHFRQTHEQDF
jgi:hypothetical protein